MIVWKNKNLVRGFVHALKKAHQAVMFSYFLHHLLFCLFIYLQAQAIGEVRVTIYDLLSYNVWHCKLLIPIRPGVILAVRIPKGTRRGRGEYDPLLNSIMDYATITPFGIYKLLSIPNTFSSVFFADISIFKSAFWGSG